MFPWCFRRKIELLGFDRMCNGRRARENDCWLTSQVLTIFPASNASVGHQGGTAIRISVALERLKRNKSEGNVERGYHKALSIDDLI